VPVLPGQADETRPERQLKYLGTPSLQEKGLIPPWRWTILYILCASVRVRPPLDVEPGTLLFLLRSGKVFPESRELCRFPSDSTSAFRYNFLLQGQTLSPGKMTSRPFFTREFLPIKMDGALVDPSPPVDKVVPPRHQCRAFRTAVL